MFLKAWVSLYKLFVELTCYPKFTLFQFCLYFEKKAMKVCSLKLSLEIPTRKALGLHTQSRSQIPNFRTAHARRKLRALAKSNTGSSESELFTMVTMTHACATSSGETKMAVIGWASFSYETSAKEVRFRGEHFIERWYAIAFSEYKRPFCALTCVWPVSFFVVLKTNHRAGNFRLPQSQIISSSMRKELIGSGNEIAWSRASYIFFVHAQTLIDRCVRT